jgi:hypothetical protein
MRTPRIAASSSGGRPTTAQPSTNRVGDVNGSGVDTHHDPDVVGGDGQLG